MFIFLWRQEQYTSLSVELIHAHTCENKTSRPNTYMRQQPIPQNSVLNVKPHHCLTNPDILWVISLKHTNYPGTKCHLL